MRAAASTALPAPAAETLERSNPIFVVGFSRSGTTLLQALLGAHPRIAAPPEIHYFQRIVYLRDYWGDLSDDAVLRRVITETVQPPIPWLEHCDFDPEHIFERARTGPRTYAGVLNAVLSDFAQRNGKARWSEKTPRQDIRPIWKLFPDAQVVHIVRDPRPTIASTMSKLGGFTDAISAARAWRRFTVETLLAGARRGPSSYLRISYEDLSREPEAVMRLVFTFLGEQFDPQMVTDAKRRRAALPGGGGTFLDAVLEPIRAADDTAWRDTVKPLQRARIAAVVGNLCPGLGYEPPKQATAVLGGALNAAARPTERVRERQQRRARVKMTPQMRYDFTVREQVQRVERGAERRKASATSDA